MTTTETPARPTHPRATNGRVFGGLGFPGPTDLITDVRRDQSGATILTLGRATQTNRPEFVPVETTGQIWLTADEADVLIHWLIAWSSGQKHRVVADLWTHMLATRRRIFEQGGEPAPAEDARAQHQARMFKQEPSRYDDMTGMKLWVAAHYDEPGAKEAYDQYLADRDVRCEIVVRQVLAGSEPLTFGGILDHPEFLPPGVSHNDAGLAASLEKVLRAGVTAGWLVRFVAGSTSLWALA